MTHNSNNIYDGDISSLSKNESIVVIPIISMRSHQTNQYDLLKDGNIQYHLAWLDYIHSLNKDVRLVLCLPSSIDKISNYKFFESYTQVNYPFIEYVGCLEVGVNAAETRSKIYRSDISTSIEQLGLKSPVVVSDFPYASRFGIKTKHIVYNMNTYTKEPLVVDTGTKMSIMTIVPAIADYYTRNTTELVMLNQHSVCPRVLLNESQRVTDRTIAWYIKTAANALEQKFILNPRDPDLWFFPLRASDPCYKVNEVIALAKQYNKSLIVTDPNESFEDYAFEHSFNDYVISKNIRNNKDLYYYILSKRPNVPYGEDIEKMVHPGFMEMKFFGVNLIQI